MADIKLYSFNVRGMRDDVKRKLIFRHLKIKYPNGIYLLQETHSTVEVEKKWDLEWKRGLSYFSHGTNDSCGVAILISPELDVNVSVLAESLDGRFLAIQIKTVYNEEYTVCNIYAPTRNKLQEQLRFLAELKNIIASLDPVSVIIGGDFNTVFDPEIDKQGGDLTNCTIIQMNC